MGRIEAELPPSSAPSDALQAWLSVRAQVRPRSRARIDSLTVWVDQWPGRGNAVFIPAGPSCLYDG